MDAAFDNQRDFVRQRAADFTAKTGVALPSEVSTGIGADQDLYDSSYRDWLKSTRDAMTAESKRRNDPPQADRSAARLRASALSPRGCIAGHSMGRRVELLCCRCGMLP